MVVELGKRLREDAGLAALVEGQEGILKGVLSPSMRAFWDLRPDAADDLRVTLALSDPFGLALDNFAPADLRDAGAIRDRVHRLVGILHQSTRRDRIEVCDKLSSFDQLRELQHLMNANPSIVRANPKLMNRVHMSPENPNNLLITGLVIDVDAPATEAVKRAVLAAGFELRGERVIDKPGIQEGVRAMVNEHLNEKTLRPRYAICFDLGDPADVHLLEIADDAHSLNDGTLEGIGAAAGPRLPGARTLVLYLESPTSLRLAAEYQPSHPLFRDLPRNRCLFIHPNDGGEAFAREFPELMGKSR